MQSRRPVGPFDANRRTRRRRPHTGLGKPTADQIRSLAKQGYTVRQISDELGIRPRIVEMEMMTLRTRASNRSRFTLNVGDEAYHFIMSEKEDDEAVWETVDRLLTELQDYR